MKVVMVEFPDTVDISALTIDATVSVGTIPDGKVSFLGQSKNDSPTLIPHTHSFDSPAVSTGLPILI